MNDTEQDAPNRYQIRDLLIDSGSRRVYCDEKRLKLGGLTFDFLSVLIKHAPAMAAYDQLAEQVWKGRPVSAETIAQRAKMLRAALSDDAKKPRYFELIRGEGYRLVADVEVVSDSALRKPSRLRWLTVAGLSLLAVIVLSVVFLQNTAQTPSIAVMPFADMSPVGDQRYLADGIAEELLNQLARLDGLEVASRTESFFWRQPIDDLNVVGKALNVSAILEGSVRRVDNDLRVSVQLIDVDSGFHLWSKTYDRKMAELLVTQEDIAAAVAGALGIQLGVGNVGAFRGAGTTDIEAYEAYLYGDFERAMRIDPEYAAAWSRRALMIAGTMHQREPEEAPAILENALRHARRAIELEPTSAEAHTMHATLTYPTMRWQQAERSYIEALDLARSASTLQHYGNMMMRAGRSSRARALYDEADGLMRRRAGFSWLQVNVEIALGNDETARQWDIVGSDYARSMAKLAIELNGGSPASVRDAMLDLPATSMDYRVLVAPLLEVFDSRDDALALLADLDDDGDTSWAYKHHNIALLAAYFGDPVLALTALQRDLPYTPVRAGIVWYPLMSDVRKLPGFKQLMRDMNLDDYWRAFGWADFCRPLGADDFLCE